MHTAARQALGNLEIAVTGQGIMECVCQQNKVAKETAVSMYTEPNTQHRN
jgi:hypothetical protein